MKNKTYNNFTVALLFFGYFIDFYDLSIMGVSYNELIREQFKIFNQTLIQHIYLTISNYQTLGIMAGALIFGILGDKWGRAKVIKFSILLYSLSTLAGIFCHSLMIFKLLRFLAYSGLACEFATSATMIVEMLKTKDASLKTSILYACGILGGIFATSLGFISWKLMFAFGGIAGIIIFILRAKIHESLIFSQQHQLYTSNFGNLKLIFFNKNNLLKFIKLLILIIPYQLMITIMFIFPNYIISNYSLAYATKLLLMGFFAGNLISTMISSFIINRIASYKKYLAYTFIAYALIMPIFAYVGQNLLLIYSIGIGILGGGYPVAWILLVTKSYGINIRSTASNLLFAMGRISGILFNLLIMHWLINPKTLVSNAVYIIITVIGLSFIILTMIKDNYQTSKNYLSTMLPT